MMQEYSWWWITAVHNETGDRKTRMIKCTGPFPVKSELESYCPADVCTIIEMKWSHDSDNWVDDSEPSQEKLRERMFESINEKKKN